MRPTVFARFLLLFLALLIGLAIAFGQPVTQLEDQKVYRGNVYDRLSLYLPRADSALSTSAVISASPSGRALAGNLQPTVTRNGRYALIVWSAAQTLQLPEVAFLQIYAGTAVRYQANVYTNRSAQYTTPPGSQTVISPIVNLVPVGRKIYTLSNAPPSGYQITHNLGTPLVSGSVYREDTGQIDPLWRIIILNSNTIEVRGVPGETFSGRLVLDPVPILSN